MEWNAAFETGLETIDRQHRQLVRILKELHDAMRQGGRRRDLARVMNELVQCTRCHFSTEERLISETRYPEQVGHMQEHRALTEQAEAFAAEVLQGRATASLRNLHFLKECLNRHRLDSDRKLAAHVRSRQAA